MMEKAILVGICTGKEDHEAKQASLDELERLAATAKVKTLDKMIQKRDKIDPTYFAGKGFLENVKEKLENYDSVMVIFDNDLAPSQVRNIERDFQLDAIDRTELILSIFHDHARTREAKLQVRLAELQYQLPRLKKLWSHLDRERGIAGSAGTARGMGEKQIEIDKRLVRIEIEKVKKELHKIDRQTETQKKQRQNYKKVCLVGYTNAGKSTLFNSLTDSNVLVEDKLFATLDSTAAEINLDKGRKLILSDTVGFISNLPHHLVASFRATLQDVVNADLLLHVIDAAEPNKENHIEQVSKVLSEIGANDIPRLKVFNKIDKLTPEQKKQEKSKGDILVSATEQINLAELKLMIDNTLHNAAEYDLFFPYSQQSLVNKLHRLSKVIDEKYRNEGVVVKAIINQEDLRFFEKFKR